MSQNDGDIRDLGAGRRWFRRRPGGRVRRQSAGRRHRETGRHRIPSPTPPQRPRVTGAAAGRTSRRTAKKRPFWIELPILIVIAFGLTFLIQTFVAKVYYVPSGLDGADAARGGQRRRPHPGEQDRLRLPRSAAGRRGGLRRHRRPGRPRPGSPAPTTWFGQAMQSLGSVVGIAPPNEKDYVKRVIAVGGQTVMCCDAQGNVTVDGRSLVEPYIYEPIEFIPGELDCKTTQMSRRCFGPVTIPDGQLWVMGDHRSDSARLLLQCQGLPADQRGHVPGPDPGGQRRRQGGRHRDAAVPLGHHRQPRHRSREPGELMAGTARAARRVRHRPRYKPPPPTVRRPNLRLEKELLRGGTARLAAMDEVGRGALAGPVTVGVVVVTASIGRVPPGWPIPSCSPRPPGRQLVPRIRRWVTEYAVGHASPAEIDDRSASSRRCGPPADGRWRRCPRRSTRCCWTATTTT